MFCTFVFFVCSKHRGVSTNGKLVVWGPVVWIPRIPLFEGLLPLGTVFSPVCFMEMELPYYRCHVHAMYGV